MSSPAALSLPLSGSAFLSGGAIIDLDGSLFIQLGLFFILFFALRALVFRPMIAVFDAREASIDGAKKEARDLEKEADEKFAAFQAEMKKVKVEANAERDGMRRDAARIERDVLAAARAEADRTTTDATAAMQREATQIRADMKARIPAIASEIASKLLGRKAA